MTDLTYRHERYDEIIGDIKALLPSHWRELALNQDDIPLNPDFDLYRRADEAGNLAILSARNATGELVGYAIYFVKAHHHYLGHVWAVSDIFWLHPDYRNFGHGKEIFAQIEALLKSMNVSVMHTTLKADHPAAAFVLEAVGHKKIELGYSKKL